MHLKFRRNPILLTAGVLLIAIGLAACGSSKSSSSSSTAASAASPSAAGSGTVSTKAISGSGTVLVDSKGNALYTNDMDTASKVACTGSCTSIWVPVMAPSSGKPTSSDSAVQAKLGVVKLSGGGSQVTFGGKPLYSFVQDSPGQVTGNGAMDSFGGTSFTWTVATAPGGSSAGTGAAASTSSAGGSGGGGY